MFGIASTTPEQSEAQRIAFRAACTYRRVGRQIQVRKDLTAPWTSPPELLYSSFNEAKRAAGRMISRGTRLYRER